MEKTELKKVKEFAQMEKELHLFDREYCGYKYWHMLRFYCCEAAFSQRMEKEKEISKIVNGKKRLRNYIKKILNNIKPIINYLFVPRCDILEFSISKLHNRFFTNLDFAPEYKTNLYRVDLTDSSDTENSIRQYYIPWILFSLKNKIIKKQINDEKENNFFIEIEKEIKLRFGQSYSAQDMKNTVINYIKCFDDYRNFFIRLIKKSHSKAILLTCYYSNIYFSLIHAAHDLNIPVIELQHGVINNHIEYWFEEQQKNYEYVPDYLLTFGTAHEQWIQIPLKEKCISVGYPHQEKRLGELENITTDEKMIIVYPKISNYFEKEISEFADRIVPKGYKVIIKMHPGESKNYQIYYPFFAENKNIEIVTEQKDDIYYWLKKGKFHIMASSTVGLEAMCFEHANVIISLKSEHKQCEPLLEWNTAKGYKDVDELEKLILHPVVQNKSKCRELLWKKNSVENIRNAVRMIINGESI